MSVSYNKTGNKKDNDKVELNGSFVKVRKLPVLTVEEIKKLSDPNARKKRIIETRKSYGFNY